MLTTRLKAARKKAKLTQEELAKRVNTTKGTISNYENDHSTPSNEMLLMLAEVLDTSIDYLLGRTDDDSPTNDKNDEDLFRKWAKDSSTGIFFSEILESEEAEIEELREIWEIMKKRRKK